MILLLRLAIILSFIIYGYNFAFAQSYWFDTDTIYFDSGSNISKPSQATWKRIAIIDSVRGIFIGTYKDYSLQNELLRTGTHNPIDGTKDGLWQEYYPSGKLKSKGYFLNGYKSGKWELFHPNGRTSAVIYFSDHPQKLHYDPDFEFEVWEAYQKNGKKMIYNGSGMWEFNWQDSLIIRGGVKDGKRSHTWSVQKTSGELLIQEYYQQGAFINGTHATKDGFARSGQSLINASLLDNHQEIGAERSLKNHLKGLVISSNWTFAEEKLPPLLMCINLDEKAAQKISFGNSNYPIRTAYHDYQTYLNNNATPESGIPESRAFILCRLNPNGKLELVEIFSNLKEKEAEKIQKQVADSPNWIKFGNGIIPSCTHYFFFYVNL